MSTATALAELGRLVAGGATLTVTMEDGYDVGPWRVLYAYVDGEEVAWRWVEGEREHRCRVEGAEVDDLAVIVRGPDRTLTVEPLWSGDDLAMAADVAANYGPGPYGPAGAWSYVAR